MGRYRNPRKIAELRGATKKNPQRYRGPEVRSDYPLGEPPEYLSEAAKAVWFEIDRDAPDGVLTGADRFALEIASELMAELREKPREFTAARVARLQSALASIGLNPTKRLAAS